jgi:hypothetical protein
MNIFISPKWSRIPKSQFKNHENVNTKAIGDSCFKCLQAIKSQKYKDLAHKSIFSASQIKNKLE